MMAANSDTPNMPMLEIEKPPPWNSSGFSLPRARASGQVLHLAADRRQALLVGLADDRRDQPIRDGDGDADIDIVVEHHAVVGPARIHRRARGAVSPRRP